MGVVGWQAVNVLNARMIARKAPIRLVFFIVFSFGLSAVLPQPYGKDDFSTA